MKTKTLKWIKIKIQSNLQQQQKKKNRTDHFSKQREGKKSQNKLSTNKI